MDLAPAAPSVAVGAPQEVLAMIARALRNPLIWSPLAAVAAQLLLAAAVAAATGGGDFPRR